MNELLLDIRRLSFQADGRFILDGLDLTIHRSEIHALLGANGSGKSTLGYVPNAGTVRYHGTDLLSLKVHERAKLGLTLAWQEPARFEGITVREYLSLGQSDINPEVALKHVGLDAGNYLSRRLNKTLSGGERHRIELASVLSMKPKLAVAWTQLSSSGSSAR